MTSYPRQGGHAIVMYWEDYLEKRSLLSETSCSTAIYGDNPLGEELNTVFSVRR